MGQSGSGAPAGSWSNIAERVAAGCSPVGGEERDGAPQWIARQQVEFTIRWRADLAALNPKDRIIYPAIMDGLSPEDAITDGGIFDIIEVSETGRREGLAIRAARKADSA